MTRFYDATHDRPVIAVVQVLPNLFHGFSSKAVAADIARIMKVPGFWRLKERKA